MIKTPPQIWDVAEHLETEEDMVAYLDAALEENDSALVVAALSDIARAKGMMQVVGEPSLGRENFYQAWSSEGHPEFATVLKVVHALGLKLHASVIPKVSSEVYPL